MPHALCERVCYAFKGCKFFTTSLRINTLKFAAIDIGSNAVRLLLARIMIDNNQPFCRKESLIRIPLRLGEDAFTRGRISDVKIDQLIQTLIGFKRQP